MLCDYPLGGIWTRLYSSSQHGFSMNRFQHHCSDYREPSVMVLNCRTRGSGEEEEDEMYQFAIAVDTEWKSVRAQNSFQFHSVSIPFCTHVSFQFHSVSIPFCTHVSFQFHSVSIQFCTHVSFQFHSVSVPFLNTLYTEACCFTKETSYIISDVVLFPQRWDFLLGRREIPSFAAPTSFPSSLM